MICNNRKVVQTKLSSVRGIIRLAVSSFFFTLVVLLQAGVDFLPHHFSENRSFVVRPLDPGGGAHSIIEDT